MDACKLFNVLNAERINISLPTLQNEDLGIYCKTFARPTSLPV